MLLESILRCLVAAQLTTIHDEFIKGVGDQRGTDTALGSKYSALNNHSNFSTKILHQFADSTPRDGTTATHSNKTRPVPNTAAVVHSEILAGPPTQQPGLQWLFMDGRQMP